MSNGSHPKKFVTLTAAPAWDLTYSVATVNLGKVSRAASFRRELAGKGINVSYNLALAGHRAPAVFPVANGEVDPGNDGILAPVEMGVPIRHNITVVEESGRTTKINQRPDALTEQQWGQLVQSTSDAARSSAASWVLLAGTVPEVSGSAVGTPQMLKQSLGNDVSIAVDTSGPLLRAWIETGAVALVKPNVSELAECVGRPLATMGDVLDGARELAAFGVDYVLVSMGADGFLGVHGESVAWAQASALRVRNTIGAGDASLAGFFDALLTPGMEFTQALARAAAWGAHKVGQFGSQLLNLDSLPGATVTTNLPLLQPVTAD